MIQYTLVEKIETERITPCPEILSIEYSPPDNQTEKVMQPALYPPILLRNGTKFHILLGWRQVEYCTRQKIELPFGLCIENSGKMPEILLNIIQIKNELFGFNVFEKALTVKRLKSMEKIDSAVLACINVPNNEGMIRKYLLLSEVSDYIKSLILTGNMHEQTVFEIFQFERKEWDAVASFIGSLPGGTRKRNEIVVMLFDITRRDKKSIQAVLKESPSASILKSHIDMPQKMQKIYDYFYSVRYPNIHAHRQRFFQLLRESGIERSAHLEVPRDFENWRFKLDFSFSSLAEYRDIVSHLSEISGSPSFQALCALRAQSL